MRVILNNIKFDSRLNIDRKYIYSTHILHKVRKCNLELDLLYISSSLPRLKPELQHDKAWLVCIPTLRLWLRPVNHFICTFFWFIYSCFLYFLFLLSSFNQSPLSLSLVSNNSDIIGLYMLAPLHCFYFI